MLQTFLIVLPVFGVIFAGWAVRRLGLLGATATSEINRFVVWLALPALMFDIMASAKPREIWQPGFIATFALSALVVFALTVVISRLAGKPLADASVDGLNAGYANTAYIGIPLLVAIYGDGVLIYPGIASLLTICALFAVAIAVLETGLATEAREDGAAHGPLAVARIVAGRMARNPIVVAPVLGAFFPLTGSPVPVPIDRFVTLLGAAAAPSALVAVGLFLASSGRDAQDAPAPAPPGGKIAALVTAKLLLQPVLAWVLATQVFALDTATTHIAVLIAALPTGTGPFMLAEFYRREAATTARVILISTIIAVGTVTAYIALVAQPG